MNLGIYLVFLTNIIISSPSANDHIEVQLKEFTQSRVCKTPSGGEKTAEFTGFIPVAKIVFENQMHLFNMAIDIKSFYTWIPVRTNNSIGATHLQPTGSVIRRPSYSFPYVGPKMYLEIYKIGIEKMRISTLPQFIKVSIAAVSYWRYQHYPPGNDFRGISSFYIDGWLGLAPGEIRQSHYKIWPGVRPTILYNSMGPELIARGEEAMYGLMIDGKSNGILYFGKQPKPPFLQSHTTEEGFIEVNVTESDDNVWRMKILQAWIDLDSRHAHEGPWNRLPLKANKVEFETVLPGLWLSQVDLQRLEGKFHEFDSEDCGIWNRKRPTINIEVQATDGKAEILIINLWQKHSGICKNVLQIDKTIFRQTYDRFVMTIGIPFFQTYLTEFYFCNPKKIKFKRTHIQWEGDKR